MSKKYSAAPLSDIPYGIKREVGEFVYSIDKFRPRFPLRWQHLRLQRDGKILPLSDDNIIKAVASHLIHPLYCYNPQDGISHGSSRNPQYLHWWSVEGFLIVLEKFKPFGSQDYNYSVFVEFNPNKHLNSPFPALFVKRVKDWIGEDYFCWYNTRCDFTLDCPYPISDIRLLSRKSSSSYLGTYYFGVRGSPGYTRVYDKRREMKDHYGVDIGRDVTRIEWEQHRCKCTFDTPYRLGDLGRYEVLRFVPMNDWPAALRTYDRHTAAKIRKSCLYALPFQPELFQDMFDELLCVLDLHIADCCDTFPTESDRMDQAAFDAESRDLEYIMSSLRRFAQVDD